VGKLGFPDRFDLFARGAFAALIANNPTFQNPRWPPRYALAMGDSTSNGIVNGRTSVARMARSDWVSLAQRTDHNLPTGALDDMP
jgi:hypothetical protein